ncbi:MAG: lytic transglycosylase domain-containing protein, partial [Pseudomonadota bacterium]
MLITLLWAPLALAEDAMALQRALEARTEGDWDKARAEAARSGPLASDIIEWHRLRAREGTFDETRAFLERNRDWPGLPLLRARSEHSITARTPSTQVLEFFVPQAPRTGHGALRYAAALDAEGLEANAHEEIIRAWTTLSLELEEEVDIIVDYGVLLSDHHWARTDMLLWRGLTEEARRMLPRLGEAEQRLASARIALRNGADGVNDLINAVPAARAGDPGLAYERFLWRVNRGQTDSAITLLEAQTELGDPEAWGNLRRRYARQLMRAGEDRRAYALASRHGLGEGRNYADLEFVSGYIALRKLGDADAALRHFERLEAAVDTPISLGRAQYWQARAHEAVGNTELAQEGYTRAAEHQTAFYGQLAAEALGLPGDPALAGTEAFPDWRGAAFTQTSVHRAARLLLEAGDLNLGERFLTHQAETLSRTEIGQMAAMVRGELDEPHLEVMIAKRAVQYGHVIEGPYFPLHPLTEIVGGVPPELALAIARRESEFDPAVSSGVG